MLTGAAILDAIEKKEIEISPFNREQLGPNSYDLTLHNELLVYRDKQLDMKLNNPIERIIIPEEGYAMQPGKIYLGRTKEWTGTDCYVPMLEGRSSIGRLGLYVHITAGFGNIGSSGNWTLELSCVQPLIVYPGVRICQVYFVKAEGEINLLPEQNKYKDANDIEASKLWREF